MKVGIYWLLDVCPIWLLAFLLVFFAINILFIIRDYREGFPYNISVGSQQGTLFLVVAILIGATIVQRQPVLASWLDGRLAQIFWMLISIVISITIGAIYQVTVVTLEGWGKLADTYHNLFVVPLMVFFLGVTAPVVFIYGTETETLAFVALMGGWATCVLIDYLYDRLQQQKWLAERGIHLPLGIKK